MTTAQQTTPAATLDSVLNALNWRYATKTFDASKKLTQEQWNALEQALVLTPSSYGLQPWRFINVQDANVRKQLKEVSWNQTQITDASHMVVLAAKAKVEAKDVEHYIETIAKVRGIPAAGLEQYKQMMLGDVVNGPRAAWAGEWAARQCYIAMGNLLTTAALAGIDACPMEGIDPAAYDRILNMETTGYKCVAVVTLGYRAEADKSAQYKKVRYPASEVILKR